MAADPVEIFISRRPDYSLSKHLSAYQLYRRVFNSRQLDCFLIGSVVHCLYDWSWAEDSIHSIFLLRTAFFFRILFHFSEARGSLSINLPLSPLSALGSPPPLSPRWWWTKGIRLHRFLYTYITRWSQDVYNLLCFLSLIAHIWLRAMHVSQQLDLAGWLAGPTVGRWTKTHTYLWTTPFHSSQRSIA